jgi:hypothetical protein
MPRGSGEIRSELIATPSSRALVASAKNLTLTKSGKKRKDVIQPKVNSGEAWQDECWNFYDLVPEYRYACDWVGNLISKAILYAVDTPAGTKTENQTALDLMASLFGGVEGQQQALREIGIHLTVAGECYIVADDPGPNVPDEWYIVASVTLTRDSSGKFKIGDSELVDPMVIRLWRPHPKNPKKANSPSRAVLPILQEILGYTKYVSAQLDSRLAGAGILAIPSEITFPARQRTEDPGADAIVSLESSADAFAAELADTMATAISNREDASSLVPIIVQAAGEYLDKIQHITFWSELDAAAPTNRNEAIRRLALGMDMPPEVLLGTADLNHWSAWAVDEAAIKAHSEPLLSVITFSIADSYLHPLLRAEGQSEEVAQGITIWADTSKLRLRPNRSKEALELYDRFELSGEALRRENGFEPSDKMEDDERVGAFIRKVASGSTTPELVAQALKLLGVNVDPSNVQAEPTQERPIPSLLEHPTRELPNGGDVPDDVAAAAQVMVFRALERCGNKLKNHMAASSYPAGVEAADLYQFATIKRTDVDSYIADAFTMVDRVVFDWITPQALASGLEAYLTSLLTHRQAHNRETLCRYLRQAKAFAEAA